MAQDNQDATLTARLMARGGPGLSRRTMPDGGEVYSGPVAKRALRALNARAFTMDRSIFVDDDFDPSNPEDAALYAHERHHQENSGGEDDHHGPRDAEEIAARAIERMVLHRAERGDSLQNILDDIQNDRGLREAEGTERVAGSGQDADNEASAEAVYEALLASGIPHAEIVRDLTDHVVRTLMTLEEDQGRRTTDASLF